MGRTRVECAGHSVPMAPDLALPDELLFAVFIHLPLSPSGAVDLANSSRVSRRVHLVAGDRELWEAQYRARWPTGLRVHADCNWKAEYARRHAQDCQIDELLDSMVRSPRHRIQHAEAFLEFGTEAVDRLELHRRSLPREARPDSRLSREYPPWPVHVPDDWLCRAYWANEVLSLMRRLRAISDWTSLAQGRPLGFEETLAGFAAFRGGDVTEVCMSVYRHNLAFVLTPFQISDTFEALAERMRAYLKDQGIQLDGGDVRDIALGIISFMRVEGFRGADIAHYHDLSNHFLHFVLDTDRRTLPMSLACVFVALARRVGLRASPVNMPRHLFVVVDGFLDSSHISSNPDPFYLDAYSDDRPILDRQALVDFVVDLNMPPVLTDDLLVPADSVSMALRTSRNIFASVRQHDGSARTLIGSAYAAAAARAMLSDSFAERSQAAGWIAPMIRQAFPLDVGLLETTFAPLATEATYLLNIAKEVRDADEDGAPVTCKRRSHPANVNVRFRVGQVFRHRQQGYLAVVTGWDPMCEQDKSWIRAMGVDQLTRGRRQPFYHTMADDASTR
jgi:F-box protein 21